MFFFDKDALQVIDEIRLQTDATNIFDQPMVIKNDVVLKDNASLQFNNGGVVIGSLIINDSASIKIEKNPLIVKSNTYINSNNSILGDMVCLGKTTIITAKEITNLQSVELDSQAKSNDISANMLSMQKTVKYARIADDIMDIIGQKDLWYSKIESPWCKYCKKYKGSQVTCPHCNQ